MLAKLRPTLIQLFVLSLAGLALTLALLFYLFRDGSQRELLQSSERLRDSASRQVAERVTDYLNQAPVAGKQFEELAQYGQVKLSDIPSLEAALLSLILANQNLSEATFTFGQSRGFDNNGYVQLARDSICQVTIFRSDRGGIERRHVWFDGRQFLSEREPLAPGKPSIPGNPVPTADPTEHLTFRTPSNKANLGNRLWTDLHFTELDESLPEAGRRVEVSVVKAVNAPDGQFAGVIRIGLTTEQLDRAIQVRLVDPGQNDPHMVFLCDRQGRLITGFGKQAAVESGDDLRIPARNLPEQVMAAIRQPALKTVDADNPLATATFSVGKDVYLATFRAMPPDKTQDWIVGIVVPRSYYLEPLLRIQRQVLWLTSLLMLSILMAGSIILRKIALAHSLIVEETERMQSFDFKPSHNSSPLRDIQGVLNGLEKAKTAMRAMGKYVPTDLVRRLYRDGSEPVLGAELTELTVMFTDIQEFTPIAERLTPDELAAILGQYLQMMADVIQEERGTVDKYMGDAVMAFWNAPEPVPNHPVLACRAALRCRDRVRELCRSSEWKGQSAFETRFGLHLCKASVGHFGAPDRFNYTAIGDGVNLASRLEALNKYYGTTILVSQSLYAATAHEFDFRLLDRVSVKGKTEGVAVYELIDHKLPGRERPAYVSSYERAFEAYQRRNFREALTMLDPEANDRPARQLSETCRKYIEDPPPESWQGVRVFTTK